MLRLIVADDHGAVREALVKLLERETDIVWGVSLTSSSAPFARRAEDPRELGLVLTGWGAALALNGRHRAARKKTEEALAIFRENGDIWGAALALGDLGELCRAQGDWQRAERLYEGCQALAEEIQAAVWLRSARPGLGFVALAQEQPATATRLFGNSLHLAEEQGEREGMVRRSKAARRGEVETAVRLAGACDAYWKAYGLNPSGDAARRARLVAVAGSTPTRRIDGTPPSKPTPAATPAHPPFTSASASPTHNAGPPVREKPLAGSSGPPPAVPCANGS